MKYVILEKAFVPIANFLVTVVLPQRDDEHLDPSARLHGLHGAPPLGLCLASDQGNLGGNIRTSFIIGEHTYNRCLPSDSP